MTATTSSSSSSSSTTTTTTNVDTQVTKTIQAAGPPNADPGPIRDGATAYGHGAQALRDIMGRLDAAVKAASGSGWSGTAHDNFMFAWEGDQTSTGLRTEMEVAAKTFDDYANGMTQLADGIQHAIDIRHAAEILAAAAAGVCIILCIVTVVGGIAGALATAAEVAADMVAAQVAEDTALAVARALIEQLISQFSRQLIINLAKKFVINWLMGTGFDIAFQLVFNGFDFTKVDYGSAIIGGFWFSLASTFLADMPVGGLKWSDLIKEAMLSPSNKLKAWRVLLQGLLVGDMSGLTIQFFQNGGNFNNADGIALWRDILLSVGLFVGQHYVLIPILNGVKWLGGKVIGQITIAGKKFLIGDTGPTSSADYKIGPNDTVIPGTNTPVVRLPVVPSGWYDIAAKIISPATKKLIGTPIPGEPNGVLIKGGFRQAMDYFNSLVMDTPTTALPNGSIRAILGDGTQIIGGPGNDIWVRTPRGSVYHIAFR